MGEQSDHGDENGKPLRSFFGAETPEAAIVHRGDSASTIISDEAIVQKQLELASLQPELRVLEIGVGTGYLRLM
jgi:protein-L-isoaspartate O-methyltransferase